MIEIVREKYSVPDFFCKSQLPSVEQDSQSSKNSPIKGVGATCRHVTECYAHGSCSYAIAGAGDYGDSMPRMNEFHRDGIRCMRHLGLETFVLGRALDTTLQEEKVKKVIGIPAFGKVSVLVLPQKICLVTRSSKS